MDPSRSEQEARLALLNPALPQQAQTFRPSVAMLAATGNNPDRLAELAMEARAEQEFVHIANPGRRFEPDDPFWSTWWLALRKPVLSVPVFFRNPLALWTRPGWPGAESSRRPNGSDR